MSSKKTSLPSSSAPDYKIRKFEPKQKYLQNLVDRESTQRVLNDLAAETKKYLELLTANLQTDEIIPRRLNNIEKLWHQELVNLLSAPTYDAIKYPFMARFLMKDIDQASLDAFRSRSKKYLELDTEQSQTIENVNNLSRLGEFEKNFTNELITLISEDDFEYGFESKVDIYIQKRLHENALATKAWLNSIFLEQFENIPILLGLLRVVARVDYFEIYPEGQTMAIAALSHRNVEVRECGVRAFESWETIESLHILENLVGNVSWLQRYIDKVVLGLRRKYNVKTGTEN